MLPSLLNIGFRRTDRKRFDTIAALGSSPIYRTGPTIIPQGIDILGDDGGVVPLLPYLSGMHEEHDTSHFKIMVRSSEWKYIYMANGGRGQIFNLIDDPHEPRNCIAGATEVASEMRSHAA